MASTDAVQRAAKLSQPEAISLPESAAREEAVITSDIDLLVATGERDSLRLAGHLHLCPAACNCHRRNRRCFSLRRPLQMRPHVRYQALPVRRITRLRSRVTDSCSMALERSWTEAEAIDPESRNASRASSARIRGSAPGRLPRVRSRTLRRRAAYHS